MTDFEIVEVPFSALDDGAEVTHFTFNDDGTITCVDARKEGGALVLLGPEIRGTPEQLFKYFEERE